MLGGVIGSAAAAEFLPWAEKATTDLARLRADAGWKRAFRIWGAAFAPDAESLVDALLQRDETKVACMRALAATEGAAVLRLALSAT